MNKLIVNGKDTGIESIDFISLVHYAKGIARDFPGYIVEIICENTVIFRYFVLVDNYLYNTTI